MKEGDRIEFAGYDIVATATVTEGGGPPMHHTIVVLNNNSSHYLLAWSDEACEHGYFINSFAYHLEYEGAYHLALDLMVHLAKSN